MRGDFRIYTTAEEVEIRNLPHSCDHLVGVTVQAMA